VICIISSAGRLDKLARQGSPRSIAIAAGTRARPSRLLTSKSAYDPLMMRPERLAIFDLYQFGHECTGIGV
jgi:hypothetical protein